MIVENLRICKNENPAKSHSILFVYRQKELGARLEFQTIHGVPGKFELAMTGE